MKSHYNSFSMISTFVILKSLGTGEFCYQVLSNDYFTQINIESVTRSIIICHIQSLHEEVI